MTVTTPALDAVETLLADAFGVPVAIGRSHHLAPWSVVRYEVADPAPGVPASVIVKWLRDNPIEFRTDPRQVATERAALEFLAGLGFPSTPRVLTSDLDAGLLVLEDVAPRVALDTLIRRTGVGPSVPGLLAFARATGELAARTAGHGSGYAAARSAYGPHDPAADLLPILGAEWSATRRRMDEFGGAMGGAAADDLARMVAELSHPGAFLAFSNGDAASNNFLVEPGDWSDGRIIDFEFAGFRNALVAATWIHLPGSGWITVTDPVNDAVEAEYRHALSDGIPEATDDRRYGLAMAAACLSEALRRLNRLPILDERPPGHTSRVQMVATLETAADTAERHRSLPHLTGWVRAVAGLLRRRWTDADVDFTGYPSYLTRG